MAIKEETSIQRSIQQLIVSRRGYIPHKNHGNMITIKGLHDLPFLYKGFSCFFEVKTPEVYYNAKNRGVSEEQGIHCRLARKSFGLTAIVCDVYQAGIILDKLDYCDQLDLSPQQMLSIMESFFESRGLDDGTKY